MQAAIVNSINEVPAEQWDRLHGAAQPFLKHAFLKALEDSGSVGDGTGWNPAYLAVYGSDGILAGAMPLYIKTDSFGEFVFDSAWADAHHRAGFRYFPKLVAAVPFTPVTGRRLLLHPSVDPKTISAELIDGMATLADEIGASSVHVLFEEQDDHEALVDAGYSPRKDCQFHWHNEGFGDFDEFLSVLTSAKRKNIRRERRRVRENGISVRLHEGDTLEDISWDEIYGLYANTFYRYGHRPYLSPPFFPMVATALAEQVVVATAHKDDHLIAMALFLRDDRRLYGRYWGCESFEHSLHFELCYYQGIEYCIRHSLQIFEPGTQGEHKIARGFSPVETSSVHRIRHPRFATVIDDYLERERGLVDAYIDAARSHLPFRAEHRC